MKDYCSNCAHSKVCSRKVLFKTVQESMKDYSIYSNGQKKLLTDLDWIDIDIKCKTYAVINNPYIIIDYK